MTESINSFGAISHIFSIGTDSFYQPDENYIHERMSKLYMLKTKEIPDWKRKSVNRVLKKHKDKLIKLLNSKINCGLIRELNKESLKEKSIVSLFESSLTRACDIKPDELSEKLFQVEFYFYQVMNDLIKNGFNYDGKHYVYFSSSAGSIRKHRGLFIEENLYNKIQMKLTCGLTINKINSLGGCVINKWLAYLSLSSSATTVWKDFDIDKAIVCDDKEIEVWGDMDYIDALDYSVTRKYTNVDIPLNDGVGMMLRECGTTRVVRGPFIKGLLVCFPFDKFIQEKCNGNGVVCDIYGKKHDIVKEDIKYIFTKSQFKMAKYYDSWEQYKENFKKYNCEIGYCNVEAPYVPKARINYQMLNSLHDITDEEIERLTESTNEEICSIGNDFQTTMRLLGATDYNQNKSPMQEALTIYPELFRDSYNREILKQVKNSLVKQAKSGRLRINGYYRLASPDLYAYCEWLFLGIENPQGLLKNGEVAISQFKDGEELDCLRSPHLYFEHCLRTNNQSEEVKKWFDTKCIYTASHDLMSRVLALDFDGDILLVTNDKTIKKVVKRNQSNYVPLLFDMKKANSVEINSQNIYDGLIAAFKYGKIGIYSNSCAKIWNKEQINEDSLKSLKLLVAESNWSIDAAKCLYMPPRPESANKLITSQTKGKLPFFFKYAKDKNDFQCEQATNSAMNRIVASIIDSNIKYNKSINKFDYRYLMNQNVDYTVLENSKIVQSYNYWLKYQNKFGYGEDSHINENDIYKYRRIRKEIVNDSNCNLDYIVNSLVAYVYTLKKSSNKKMLWACFGDVIVSNLKNNVEGKVCRICGKRFQPRDNSNVIYCSCECAHVGKLQYDRKYRKTESSKNH